MTPPTLEQLAGQIEALLFVSGEPLSREKLQAFLQVDAKTFDEALVLLQSRYKEDPTAGISLIEHDDTFELATKPAHAGLIESFTKSFIQEHLSKAALEVLSIIAYRGPITRAMIEAIRGVNCSFTLRNLLLRGLIERKDNPEDAREYVYTASIALLEKLGLSHQQDLPNFDTLSKDARLDQVLSTAKTPEESVPLSQSSLTPAS